MKKTIAITMALALALGFSACGKTEEPSNNPENSAAEEQTVEQTGETSETSENVGLANPMVAVDSLEAINEKLGCNLVHPGVMGIVDESFFVTSDKLGEYNFNVNGVPYTFRFCNETEDISGVYAGEATLLADAEDGAVVSGAGYTGARWFAEEGQYCLITPGEVDETLFAGIVEEIMNIQRPGTADVAELPSEIVSDPVYNQSWYDNLAGSWQDMTSGRAAMDVESLPGHALINVHWGDSASTSYEWTMNVTMEEAAEDGTNKLTYSDCTQRKVENDGTTETVTIIYENGEGYFTLNEAGFLAWDGAADDNCAECVFEQIIQ